MSNTIIGLLGEDNRLFLPTKYLKYLFTLSAIIKNVCCDLFTVLTVGLARFDELKVRNFL